LVRTPSNLQESQKVMKMFERLKLYDWTFSATADIVVAALLAIAIIVSVISLT
jgi:hypothetical protein